MKNTCVAGLIYNKIAGVRLSILLKKRLRHNWGFFVNTSGGCFLKLLKFAKSKNRTDTSQKISIGICHRQVSQRLKFLKTFKQWKLFLNLEDKLWLDMFVAQKQPSKGVLGKRCSENMQQIYWRTPMPKCKFNKVAWQLY